MIRVAICDDNREELSLACRLLEKYRDLRPEKDLRIRPYTSAKTLLSELKGGRTFQVYLLDILMPGMDGIEVGKKIRQIDRDGAILYLTSTRDYALDAYDVFAFQYLIKPVEQERFFAVMDELLERYRPQPEPCHLVKTSAGMQAIPYHSILYVECKNHVLLFHLENRTTIASSHIRTTFEEASAELLLDERFLHPHKSYILNMDFVRQLESQSFLLWDGESIPIARKNYAEMKSSYIRYLARKGKNLGGGM